MNLDLEDGLAFKAGVLLIYISQTAEFGLQTLSEKCGYDYKEVETIIGNLRKNKIITDENKFNIEMGNEETNRMEFILMCITGAGDIVRIQTPTGESNYSTKSSLNRNKT